MVAMVAPPTKPVRKKARRESSFVIVDLEVRETNFAVIKKAWKDNEQNKEISVYGKAIKLTHLVTKILPHSLFLQFIGRK